MGSAKNTPSTPNPILGNRIVKGTMIITFLNREKNIALFLHLRAVKIVCPVACPVMKTKPKKYNNRECVPVATISILFVNMEIIAPGYSRTMIHAMAV